jgi:hypothetical protein
VQYTGDTVKPIDALQDKTTASIASEIRSPSLHFVKLLLHNALTPDDESHSIDEE